MKGPERNVKHLKKKGRLVDYRLQFDEALNSDTSKQLREALRYDETLLQWIDKFYRTFRSVRNNEELTKQEVLDFYCKLAKVLVPSVHYDPEMAFRAAE